MPETTYLAYVTARALRLLAVQDCAEREGNAEALWDAEDGLRRAEAAVKTLEAANRFRTSDRGVDN